MEFDEELFGNLDKQNKSSLIAVANAHNKPASKSFNTNPNLFTTKPKQNGVITKNPNFSKLIKNNTSTGFTNLFSNIPKKSTQPKSVISESSKCINASKDSYYGNLLCQNILQSRKLIENKNLLSRLVLPSEKMQNFLFSLTFKTEPFSFDTPEPVVFDSSKSRLEKIPGINLSVIKKSSDVIQQFKRQTSKPESNDTQTSLNIDRSHLLKAHAKLVGSCGYKESITITVIGNADSGKSTFLGQILRQSGLISEKIVSKLKWESTKMHNEDLSLAWVIDDTEEERFRKTTLYSSHVCFETNLKRIIAHDSPSRIDLLSEAIPPLCQSDAVVLLIDGSVSLKTMKQQFSMDSCLNYYLKLMWWFGIKHLILVVNKMDAIDWNIEKYKALILQLTQFTQELELDLLRICAVSAGDGKNITQVDKKYSLSESLFDCIDSLPSFPRNVDCPLRYSVSNLFTPIGSGDFAVEGRVVTGGVSCGINSPTAQLISPHACFSVKSIRSSAFNNEEVKDSVGDISLSHAFAGDYVTLVVTSSTQPLLRHSTILCDKRSHLNICQQFYAEIRVFDDSIPIIPGYTAIFHYFSSNVPCIIETLCIAKTNHKSSQESVTKKPRYLLKGMTGTVIIRLEETIFVDSQNECDSLNKFVLLNLGKIGALGIIIDKSIDDDEFS